jgi:hypothetical protein
MSDIASEVNRRDRFQVDIRLDERENFTALQPGEGEQDKCRANSIDVGALTSKKGHGVHPVGRRVQNDGPICIAKCLRGQPRSPELFSTRRTCG